MSRPLRNVVALFHDVEQDLDNAVDPEACRRALRDLLALERSAGVRSTCLVAGRLLETQPELGRWIRSAGAEVAFHSYHHPADWNPSHYAAEVVRCREFSGEPLGYRSPRNQWNAETLDAEWRNGFAWSAEGDFHDEPYFIHEGLVRLPLGGDDWQLHCGRTTVEAWVGDFGRLLERRSFAGYGCHDFVVALQPETMIRAWSDILRLSTAAGRATLTLTESADLFRRSALHRGGGLPEAGGAGPHPAPAWLARLCSAPGARVVIAGGDPFRDGALDRGRTEYWDPLSDAAPPPDAPAPPAALLSRGIAEYLLPPDALLEAFTARYGPGLPVALSLPGPASPAPPSPLARRIFRRFGRSEAERLAAALADGEVVPRAADAADGDGRWLVTGRTRPLPPRPRRPPIASRRAPFHHIAPGERPLARWMRRALRALRERLRRTFEPSTGPA